MKRILLAGILCFGSALIAQNIVTTIPQYRTAVLEEYTGIHCQYCPDGHRIAKEIKADYPNQMILVNVHQGGYAVPSGSEPDFRTPYGDPLELQTGLTGYPAGTINREVFSSLGNTMALSRSQWRAAAEEVMKTVSPLNLGATTTYNSSTRTITINVEGYYTTAGTGSYNLLNIALIEDSLIGPQTGASTWNPADVLPNGKYVHGHVLRDFVTGQWGDTISSTTQGSLYSKTFTYVIPADRNGIAIDPNHCHLALYATEGRTRIVQGITLGIDGDSNDGNTAPYYGNFNNLNAGVMGAPAGTNSTFTFNFNSALSSAEDFVFELSDNAPSSWTADYKVNGTTYTARDTINISNSGSINMKIDVTPGSDVALAKYTLTIYPVFDPNNKIKMEVNVISGITDLIVDGTGSWGDGNTYNWDQVYKDGLIYAGNNSYALTDADIMKDGINSSAFTGVENLYLNVAWKFPSFTDDQITALEDFMDNGGNVFIAGQDMGWEINTPTSGYATTINKDFYTNYLKASFVSDGSTANNQLIADSTDIIFGGVSSSTIQDVYAGNMYPDEMIPLNGAAPVFYYNSTQTKIGGIRYQSPNYKLVYLGIGVEMIQDVQVKNEILKLSYQWFKGLISAEEFDFLAKGFRVYPNPTSGNFSVEVPVEANYGVSLVNAAGMEVYSGTLNSLGGKIDFRLNNLPKGIYLLHLSYKNHSKTQKVIIK